LKIGKLKGAATADQFKAANIVEDFWTFPLLEKIYVVAEKLSQGLFNLQNLSC
jgi:hypothetical protein